MIDKAIFIDTNILIYSNLALSPFHTQAIQRLQDFSTTPVYPHLPHNLLTTHPDYLEKSLLLPF